MAFVAKGDMQTALMRQRYQPISGGKRPSKELDSVEHKTQQATTSCFQSLKNFFGSVLNGSTLKGKIFRAIVGGGVAALVTFALASNPVGWMLVAIGFGAFAAYLLLGELAIPTIVDCIKYGVSPKQMIEFKISAWQRLNGWRGDNINHVYTHPETGAKLYLSALPNKNDPAFRQIIKGGEIGAVFSINERWEVNHEIGNSSPYTPQEYDTLGIDYHSYAFNDHGLIQEGLLNQTSEDIENALLEGKNCIVHCRAGVGRSSQLIAGNLIRFGNMDADTAAQLIKYGDSRGIQGRSQATIMRKLDNKVDKHGEVSSYGLRHYATRNQGRGFLEESLD